MNPKHTPRSKAYRNHLYRLTQEHERYQAEIEDVVQNHADIREEVFNRLGQLRPGVRSRAYKLPLTQPYMKSPHALREELYEQLNERFSQELNDLL